MGISYHLIVHQGPLHILRCAIKAARLIRDSRPFCPMYILRCILRIFSPWSPLLLCTNILKAFGKVV
jgi:hypothetical protein